MPFLGKLPEFLVKAWKKQFLVVTQLVILHCAGKESEPGSSRPCFCWSWKRRWPSSLWLDGPSCIAASRRSQPTEGTAVILAMLSAFLCEQGPCDDQYSLNLLPVDVKSKLLLQRSCRPKLTPMDRIAAVSELKSDCMAFLWSHDSLLIRMEKKIGKNLFSFTEHRRGGVRSRVWPLVPLGWGSLRKEGLSFPELISCFVLSLPSAAGNRHPHAPEQSKR